MTVIAYILILCYVVGVVDQFTGEELDKINRIFRKYRVTGALMQLQIFFVLTVMSPVLIATGFIICVTFIFSLGSQFTGRV